MSTERIQPRPYLKMLLLAAVLGLASAVITFLFVVLVHADQTIVWEQIARSVGLSTPIFTLLVCTLGGVLVGVLVKIFGDHSGIFAELMMEFGYTGRFNYRHAPGIVVTALASLIAGGTWARRPRWPMPAAVWARGRLISLNSMSDKRAPWVSPASAACWRRSSRRPLAARC